MSQSLELAHKYAEQSLGRRDGMIDMRVTSRAEVEEGRGQTYINHHAKSIGEIVPQMKMCLLSKEKEKMMLGGSQQQYPIG